MSHAEVSFPPAPHPPQVFYIQFYLRIHYQAHKFVHFFWSNFRFLLLFFFPQSAVGGGGDYRILNLLKHICLHLPQMFFLSGTSVRPPDAALQTSGRQQGDRIRGKKRTVLMLSGESSCSADVNKSSLWGFFFIFFSAVCYLCLALSGTSARLRFLHK